MNCAKPLLCFLIATIGCNQKDGNTRADKIANIVQEAFEDKQFTGNVLVADSGRIIYHRSFGMADKAKGIRNTAGTRFLVGSLSKQVTAILMLKLVHEGLVKTADTMGKYFPGLDPAVGRITVHQLLTHTSGIKELLNEKEDMDIAALLRNAELDFDPGTDFKYSNSGYVLLKEVAERASGKEFSALVQEHVFVPAGMANSGAATDSILAYLPMGYIDALQSEVVNITFPMKNIDGAGSIYATTEDLYKLDRVLYTEQVLPESMKALMHKQHVPGEYSYGWFVKERGGLWDVYWHRGSLPGFTAFISRRIQKDQFIVILSNTDDADLWKIEKDISRVLND